MKYRTRFGEVFEAKNVTMFRGNPKDVLYIDWLREPVIIENRRRGFFDMIFKTLYLFKEGEKDDEGKITGIEL